MHVQSLMVDKQRLESENEHLMNVLKHLQVRLLHIHKSNLLRAQLLAHAYNAF